jgi:anti-sigma regulatory factor (Ser/Thr protein kinase)
VLSFNQALTRTLFFSREDIIGHPFRTIIHNDYYSNKRINEKILTRLKEVFSGSETTLICSCRRKDDNEPVTVTFRLIPVMDGTELRNILVIGGPMQPDTLTKNYLVRETSSYVLDNNLSQIFLLCHRLTRNLEDRLPRSTILMAQIGLQEVFMNSIEHGNLEIDYEQKTSLKMQKGNYWEILVSACNQEYLTHRKIHVSYLMDRERVVYTIRDEGKGFDWRGYMNADREVIEKGLLSDYHGVGLQIVKNVFEVAFNEAGNEVTLTRNFSARELPGV